MNNLWGLGFGVSLITLLGENLHVCCIFYITLYLALYHYTPDHPVEIR